MVKCCEKERGRGVWAGSNIRDVHCSYVRGAGGISQTILTGCEIVT